MNARRQRPAAPAVDQASHPAPPVLAASVLGPFRVTVDGRAIDDWLSCKAKAICKYFLLHHGQPAAKEVLMDTFWPAAGPAAARNSLNVAVHRLRRALERAARPERRGFRFVVFADGHYALNPALTVASDVDAFLARAADAGELERHDADAALRQYAACIALYRGELLAEDRYAAWLAPLRQQLRDRFLHVLDRASRIHFDRREYAPCAAACASLIAVDACNEEAHRMLMRCYAALDQPQLVRRQYQTCVGALDRELGLQASAETTDLYRAIAQRRAA